MNITPSYRSWMKTSKATQNTLSLIPWIMRMPLSATGCSPTQKADMTHTKSSQSDT